MDFRSFQRGRQKNSEHHEEDTLRQKAESYSKKSDDELLREIIDMAQVGKADGSLSDEKLYQFMDQVTPMLNEEQRERLNNVINMIKG